jgi:hypothetical protein
MACLTRPKDHSVWKQGVAQDLCLFLGTHDRETTNQISTHPWSTPHWLAFQYHGDPRLPGPRRRSLQYIFGNTYKSYCSYYFAEAFAPPFGIKTAYFSSCPEDHNRILKRGRGVVHSRSSCIKPRPSISSVPSPPLVRIKLSNTNMCSFTAMDQANFIRRWPLRFRYLFHVWRARYHGLQEILWEPSLVPPRRNHLRHAIWLPGWSSIILIHCGQMVSKDQYSDCFCLLGYWIDVCAIQLPHVSRRADQYLASNVLPLISACLL